MLRELTCDFLLGCSSNEAGPSGSSESIEQDDDDKLENIENLIQIHVTNVDGKASPLEEFR